MPKAANISNFPLCTISQTAASAGKPKRVGVQKIDSVDRGQYTIIRTKYNGPYIELKRLRGGTVSAAQKQWIARLRDAGYAVEVCKGWEAAAAVITNYLEGRYKPQFQCE